MGKFVAVLIAAGAVAWVVKGAVDEAGNQLALVRQGPTAPADPTGRITPGDDPELLPFTDPLGFVTFLAPGVPERQGVGSTFHGVGRRFRLRSEPRKLTLWAEAEFIGGDAPNTPRETLGWVAIKFLPPGLHPQARRLLRYSSPDPAGEACTFAADVGGDHAVTRYKLVLVKKWLYAATASGPREQVARPDVDAFLDSFAATTAAAAHPDGGAARP